MLHFLFSSTRSLQFKIWTQGNTSWKQGENVKTQMQQRVRSPWHITMSSHGICVLTWPQPSNRILPSRTQGNIRIAYAFGRSPHPHSSAMCSQASSLPPAPPPSHFTLTPKTLAHIAVHCKEMQTLHFFFSWTQGEVKHTVCHFLN